MPLFKSAITFKKKKKKTQAATVHTYADENHSL